MKKPLLPFIIFSFLQIAVLPAQHLINGKVMDRDGVPLIGANVAVKGTNTGTISTEEGRYSLSINTDTATITYSYLGYTSQEVKTFQDSVINIKLAPNISRLSEVVVTGYGTQVKSTLTGNISKIDGKELAQLPVSTIDQALQGKSAGVMIQNLTGKPNGLVRILIRGASSISASNQPLFVIDGIPIHNESTNTGGARLNPIADINFNDIESVEILKDAAAAAIYGSRASNGVVLITTKKGKNTPTHIQLDYQQGYSTPTGKRDFLNAAEYIELMQEAANNLDLEQGNSGGGFTWADWMEGRFDRHSGPSDWRKGETNTDWQDLAFSKNAQSKQAHLSILGGNHNTSFYTSFGYSDQQGILITNRFQRKSGRLNIDHKVNDKLELGIKMSLTHTSTNQLEHDGAFSNPIQLVSQAPITPPINTSAEPFLSGQQLVLPGGYFDRPTTLYYNGLLEEDNALKKIGAFRSIANAYTSYSLLPNLQIKGEAGVDIFNQRETGFFGQKTFLGQGINGWGAAFTAQIVNFNTKLLARYQIRSEEGHTLDITTGLEFQEARTDRSNLVGQDFPVDDLRTIASAAQIRFGSSSFTEFSFISYFSRFTYDFQRKYLLHLSGRVDGSSKFGTSNRHGFFPAIALGWVLSEESFLQNNQTLDFLKLRLSYGLTGNAFIRDYQSLGLYSAEAYNNEAGLQPTQLANPNLSWESTAQLNFGLDFEWLASRITGELDFYHKQTTDLLLNFQVPYTTGFATQIRNVGAIENKGAELVLQSYNTTGIVKWTTSLNLAYNKNKITQLADERNLYDPSILNITKVGYPLGAFWGAEYAGVDPQTGQALFYPHQDGQVGETTTDYNQANFVVIGQPNPDWIGGITNTFQWKNLSLTISFQGVLGNDIHNTSGQYMSCQGCWLDNQTKDQLDRWQKPGDQTSVPKAILFGGNGDQWRSNRYLSDGSYLRLKTLNLSYNLPTPWLQKIAIQKIQIYLIGQNLLTFTNYNGWDPEVSTDAWTNNINVGSEFYTSPQAKTIVLGAKIDF